LSTSQKVTNIFVALKAPFKIDKVGGQILNRCEVWCME